jgi:hypothetical protein
MMAKPLLWLYPGPDLRGGGGRPPRGLQKNQFFFIFFDGEKRPGNHRWKPIT